MSPRTLRFWKRCNVPVGLKATAPLHVSQIPK